MGLKLIWNDILEESADALVTPASRNPGIGIGLDRFVHEAAGPALSKARAKLGRIAPGAVGATPSFRLGAKTGVKWIIHALGPVWNESSGARDSLVLDGCYLRILLKAVELGCRSVAMPVLSSGKFGMPMKEALDVAVKATGDFVAAFPGLEVRIVGIDADFRDLAHAAYPDLLVEKLTAAKARKCRRKAGRREDDPDSVEDRFEMGEEGDVFEELLLEKLAGDGTFKTMFGNLWRMTLRNERAERREMKKKGIDAGERVFLVNKSALAFKSGVGENTIKHFCTCDDKTMRTSKDRLIALSAAMRLPLSYTQRFLATCGYRLGNSGRDRVVRNFFKAGGGEVAALDMALAAAKFKPLETMSAAKE